MTTNFTYQFSDTGGPYADEVDVQVSTPPNNSTGGGPSYPVEEISGTIQEQPITAEFGVGGTLIEGSKGAEYDNAVFASSQYGYGGDGPFADDGSSYYGIDRAGLEFTIGSDIYNLAFNDGNDFVLTDVTSGVITGELFLTSSNAPCYCAGTLIQVDQGRQPVEHLAIDDIIITSSGERRPIKWIGRRSYAGHFLATNPIVQPIRFRAGSLGNGLPRRDLLVSPEHAMFLDDLLIPARCLVNGSTILRDYVERVDYYHVELDTHDVLLAEGAPSESYLDDDSRGMFHNAGEFAALYPDAPMPDGFCARRVEQGAELEVIRRRLAGVAGEIALAA